MGLEKEEYVACVCLFEADCQSVGLSVFALPPCIVLEDCVPFAYAAGTHFEKQ
jgi:hypothetical protein